MDQFVQAYAVAGVIFGQVVKAVGFPAKYVPLANIAIAVPLAGALIGWDVMSLVQGLEAALAATGLYEVGKRAFGSAS
jgi:hypothetical protein